MMKIIRAILLSVIILFNSIALSGCWNYREIEGVSIVVGVAIDKSVDNRYSITVEIAEAKGRIEPKTNSKLITMTGDTVFDVIRNMISLTGKKLYWSHKKVIILNHDITKEDIVKIFDWFNRDGELRTDVNILVSKEKTAKEILESKAKTNDVVSFELDAMLKNENSLSKAPKIRVADFIITLAGNGNTPIAPAIGLDNADKQISPQIMGTAIFTKDNPIDFLNGEETKYMLFVRNAIKGGLLIQEERGKSGTTKITLEIFKNKTDIKPVLKDGNVEMNINIEATVAIDEIQGTENYIEEEGMLKLKKDTEEKMNSGVENLVKKVQTEYNSDIFGFGTKIRQDLPKEWKILEPQWENKFKDLKVTVNTQINIKNSAALYKTLPIGD